MDGVGDPKSSWVGGNDFCNTEYPVGQVYGRDGLSGASIIDQVLEQWRDHYRHVDLERGQCRLVIAQVDRYRRQGV